MGKEEDVFGKKEIMFLSHLIDSISEAERKMKGYYESNDSENFNRAKKLILNLHRKISEEIK